MSQRALRRKLETMCFSGAKYAVLLKTFLKVFFFFFFLVQLILSSCSRGVKDENYTFEKMGRMSDLHFNSYELQKHKSLLFPFALRQCRQQTKPGVLFWPLSTPLTEAALWCNADCVYFGVGEEWKKGVKWLVVKPFSSGRERIQADAAPPTASGSLQSRGRLGVVSGYLTTSRAEEPPP